MLRALIKGAGLFAFGRAPGGAAAYRTITRERLGTFATHVDKLRRVWPGYVRAWIDRCGLSIEGARIWIHEGGWTPYSPIAAFLISGNAGVMTNGEGRVLDRYLARAVAGALATSFPVEIDESRRRRVEALRWEPDAAAAVASLGGTLLDGVAPLAVPLASESIDLCHSGGALEHETPDALAAFLGECHRVLRRGGIASHVFDHRDHLHHADAKLPFLAHLALPEPAYRLLHGHALGYHNRLSPPEVASMFERAGFERIAVRRLIYPERVYVDTDEEALRRGVPGLSRRLLARRFRKLDDADLRTAAAHYLYRKG